MAERRLPPTPDNFADAYYEIASSLAGQDLKPVTAEAAAEALARFVAELPAARGAAGDKLRQQLTARAWPQAVEAVEGIRERQRQREGADLSWPEMVLSLVQALERPDRGWTAARKRDSLLRVAEAARHDAAKFHGRLGQLIESWQSAGPAEEIQIGAPMPPADAAARTQPGLALGGRDPAARTLPGLAATSAGRTQPELLRSVAPETPPPPEAGSGGLPLVLALLEAMKQTLPGSGPVAAELAEMMQWALNELRDGKARPDDAATQARVRRLAERVERLHAQRERLLQTTGELLRTFCDNVAFLVEDESWVRGQLQALRAQLDAGLTRQTVTTARLLLRDTAERQAMLKKEREDAQQALKHMLATLLDRLGRVGDRTGQHSERVASYVREIESAPNLEMLTDAVRGLLTETQQMREEVDGTRHEMLAAHGRAAALEARVRELERELTSASEQMLTDHLTQALNRRGLEQMFAAEAARSDRRKEALALALLDIDNFKRLNDRLGHQAGDDALVHLTQTIKGVVRPTDIVARYGGEEFVVLLPATTADQASTVMMRVQRALTAAFFLHDNQKVFITFSAGVALYREGESLSDLLSRADDALYEAKVSGKNRVCAAA